MENNNHVKLFYELLRALATATKTEMTSFLIDFYRDELEQFGFDKVNPILRSFLVDSHRMPSVKAIKEKMGFRQLDDEELARDAVARIRSAVAKYGSWNAKEAQAYIGPIGSHIVQMLGGWENVCSIATQKELDFILTQAREYAKIAIVKHRAGLLDEAPNFEGLKPKNSENVRLLPNKK